jgi:hypothetical protein
MKRLYPFFILGFALATPLSAHNPIFVEKAPRSPESAIEIEDPSVSRVYYSRIDPENPYTWFTFEAKEGSPITLSVGVPSIDRLRGLIPSAYLLGPGLPEEAPPFPVPEGCRALKLDTMSPPRAFREDVTGTESWIYVDLIVKAPSAGRYYFVAYPATPNPDHDKLWMVIGTKERFGLKELFSLGKIRKVVREFHEVK